ncbi:MAG: hypothetical protein ACK6CU_12625 [Deltaproteobacteria bacterium]|jgi:hypothetical protein
MSETQVESAASARTVPFAALTDAQRTELVKGLSAAGVARGHDRFLARERLALGMIPFSLVGIVALGLAAFGDACWPTQTWIWAVVYAAASMPIAYVITRAIGHSLAARRLPITPGVYVTSEDVVVAHASAAAAMRVTPISTVAAVGTPRRLPMSPHAEITLWLEGEPAEVLSVPAMEADAALESIERARTPETAERARDARRHDPLAELKRSAVWEKASRARPSSDVPRSVVLSALVALVGGVVILFARNAISDRVAVQGAIAANDVEALSCYVEHDGVHAAHVRDNALPHAAYERARASGDLEQLGQYVEAYPDGPDTAAARTDLIAHELEAARSDAWRLRGFIARFPDAPQIGEARALLPALSLAAAIEADDVGSYAFVMREHPGTPQAEEAARRRSARYAQVLGALVARGGREEASGFFRTLFAWLEAHETHDVLVRFRTPSSEALRDFDRVASALAEREVEPIAPSFSRRLSEQREALVFDRLRTAFAELAPRDVLPVVRGTQLSDALTAEQREALLARHAEDPAALAAATEALERDQDDDSGEPEIRIVYEVVPDGRLFTSTPEDPLAGMRGDSRLREALERMGMRAPAQDPIQRDERAFAGFRVVFDIEMRAPASATDTTSSAFPRRSLASTLVHDDGWRGSREPQRDLRGDGHGSLRSARRRAPPRLLRRPAHRVRHRPERPPDVVTRRAPSTV